MADRVSSVMRVVAVALAILTIAVQPGSQCSAAFERVGFIVSANPFDEVPVTHFAYEALAELAAADLVSIPPAIRTSTLTRFEIARAVFEASTTLEGLIDSMALGRADQERLGAIIATLKHEFANEFQWLLSLPLLGNPTINSGRFDDGTLKRPQVVIGPSLREEEPAAMRRSYSELFPVSPVQSGPGSVEAASFQDGEGTPDTFETDPFAIDIPGVRDFSFDVAGSLRALRSDGERHAQPLWSGPHPDYINGLYYKVQATARSVDLELNLAYSGTYNVPSDSLRAVRTHSEARAIYLINQGLRLAAGVEVHHDDTGADSQSGLDLSFDVLPRYLWGSLGLLLSSSDEYDSGISDTVRREMRTQIGIEGRLPLSDVATLKGTYLYEAYSDLLAGSSGGSQQRFATGVEYSLGPRASLTADLELIDDSASGLSSTKGLGIGYEMDDDSSLRLQFTQIDGGVDPVSRSRFSAEVRVKF